MRQAPLVEADALRLFSVVETYVPFDEPPLISIRVNTNGYKCIRFKCKTQRKEWHIDFYSKTYFLCSVKPSHNKICSTALSLIAHLYRSLELNYATLDTKS
jgi:hypothetical protein